MINSAFDITPRQHGLSGVRSPRHATPGLFTKQCTIGAKSREIQTNKPLVSAHLKGAALARTAWVKR